MAVRYTNTYFDALAFCTAQQLRSVPLLAAYLAAAALMAWFSLPQSAVGTVKWLGFGVLAAILFSAMLAAQLLFNAYFLATNGDRNFLTEHTVDLTDATFISSTANVRVEIKWPGIFAVRRAFQRLFVLEGPWRAHVIPVRAFPNKVEFEAFASQVIKRWRR